VVAAVSYGVRISLVIPRHTYPRDALVQFTVTLQNVSHQNRYLQDRQPDWGGPYSPHIIMRTPGGTLAYEEDLATFLSPTAGDMAGNYILRPGHSLTRHVRFVLEAGQVQAVMRVLGGYSGFSARPGTPMPDPSQFAHHMWRITTPFVSLKLTNEPAPSISIHRAGIELIARVRSAVPATGPALFMDSIRCWTGRSTMWSQGHQPWTATRDDLFATTTYSHCPSRQPWHAVVGWPNHRVTFIDIPNVASVK
jgi:hypothetical protein